MDLFLTAMRRPSGGRPSRSSGSFEEETAANKLSPSAAAENPMARAAAAAARGAAGKESPGGKGRRSDPPVRARKSAAEGYQLALFKAADARHVAWLSRAEACRFLARSSLTAYEVLKVCLCVCECVCVCVRRCGYGFRYRAHPRAARAQIWDVASAVAPGGNAYTFKVCVRGCVRACTRAPRRPLRDRCPRGGAQVALQVVAFMQQVRGVT